MWHVSSIHDALCSYLFQTRLIVLQHCSICCVAVSVAVSVAVCCSSCVTYLFQTRLIVLQHSFTSDSLFDKTHDLIPFTIKAAATHCNVLQHAATHCNTLHYAATCRVCMCGMPCSMKKLQHTAILCDTLQNTLQHTASLVQ